jgi:hypothetical protein
MQTRLKGQAAVHVRSMQIGMGHGLGITNSVVLRPKAGEATDPDPLQINNFRNTCSIRIDPTALDPNPDRRSIFGEHKQPKDPPLFMSRIKNRATAR